VFEEKPFGFHRSEFIENKTGFYSGHRRCSGFLNILGLQSIHVKKG
jgi:hypothetical protein